MQQAVCRGAASSILQNWNAGRIGGKLATLNHVNVIANVSHAELLNCTLAHSLS